MYILMPAGALIFTRGVQLTFTQRLAMKIFSPRVKILVAFVAYAGSWK